MNHPASPRPPFGPAPAPFLRVEKNGDVLVDVHVVPNASKTEAVGLYGVTGQPALRVRLHAPPVDGKANQALRQWLAATLGVPPGSVSLARGDTARRKQLRVSAAVAAQARWNTLLDAAQAQDV